MNNLKCGSCKTNYFLELDINKNVIWCSECKKEVISVNEYKKLSKVK